MFNNCKFYFILLLFIYNNNIFSQEHQFVIWRRTFVVTALMSYIILNEYSLSKKLSISFSILIAVLFGIITVYINDDKNDDAVNDEIYFEDDNEKRYFKNLKNETVREFLLLFYKKPIILKIELDEIKIDIFKLYRDNKEFREEINQKGYEFNYETGRHEILRCIILEKIYKDDSEEQGITLENIDVIKDIENLIDCLYLNIKKELDYYFPLNESKDNEFLEQVYRRYYLLYFYLFIRNKSMLEVKDYLNYDKTLKLKPGSWNSTDTFNFIISFKRGIFKMKNKRRLLDFSIRENDILLHFDFNPKKQYRFLKIDNQDFFEKHNISK